MDKLSYENQIISVWIPNFVHASTFAPSQVANFKYLTYFMRIVVVWCDRFCGSVFQRLVSFCAPTPPRGSSIRIFIWHNQNSESPDGCSTKQRKMTYHHGVEKKTGILFLHLRVSLWIHLALSEGRWGTLGRTSLLLLSPLRQMNPLFPSTSKNSASRSNCPSTLSLTEDSPLLLSCSLLPATFYISTDGLWLAVI